MNILLVSQCDKRALVETRRILDQFAERRGDRTWQTPITKDGLDTLRRLLRKTARKNTSVACHWIRGLDHSGLLWVVGDAKRFNAQGAVPTNTTSRKVLRHQDENNWHRAEDIRLLAQLAALLHDLGKASVAFQERLTGQRQEKNLYRHEWVSLRLFQAFVGDEGDEAWLQRLADPENSDEQAWIDPGRYQRDGLDNGTTRPFTKLPPLAAAVAWLVVTHHRLPVIPVDKADGRQDWLGRRAQIFRQAWLDAPLSLVEHNWNEIRQPAEREQIEPYWRMAGPLPVMQPTWRAQASRLARRLLDLRQRRDDEWLGNPYAMHLARLSLMLADHHYSSLDKASTERVKADDGYALFANTAPDGSPKQPLDEHLIGVARDAGLIAHALPGFERHLPSIANHRGLRKRSANPKFAWQDKAADAATGLRDTAQANGAFIVNMASTGCGKTLANARILYALADPQQGLRATYALGLRTLTLQTGRSYRADLNLGEDELAIRVGGSASRDLFEYYEQQAEAHGSASVQDLIEEDSHVLYEGNTSDHPLLARAMHDDKIRSLLSAPMLVCTVDHMVPATESTRAGRQIAPMLRLMSSDLVLDELDDYDLADLPALTRLVHWAGMLGARVILSSATLPPALLEGMFMAYRAGRVHFQRNRGADGGQGAEQLAVPCLWADEFGVHTMPCADAAGYASQHMDFVARRSAKLVAAPALRRAELLPLQIAANAQTKQVRAEFAKQLRDACLRLHGDHAQVCPQSGKRISFGLVRMANIDPLFDVALALFQLGAPEGIRIHLCTYHARFPLVQRSAIEHQLDTALNRRQRDAVYEVPEIRAAVGVHPEVDQLFVVLASPVCEVGRDWDADWAIAEPSSMRSLIQLAGRVQRHRGVVSSKPNVLIFDTNLKHFQQAKGRDGLPVAAFVRPGFEAAGQIVGDPYRLLTHRLGKLLQPDEYQALNALPRIRPRAANAWRSRESLVDLEHMRMADQMLPRGSAGKAAGPAGGGGEPMNAATAWQFPQAALTGVLPQQQPFRDDTQRSTTLAFLPDEDGERLLMHRVEESRSKRAEKLYVEVNRSLRHDITLVPGNGISSWGQFDLMDLLVTQAEHLGMSVNRCAQRMATVEVPESEQGWRYHPWLGLTKQ
jgi:CRISPR-associated endonuclease/helicase Cas3